MAIYHILYGTLLLLAVIDMLKPFNNKTAESILRVLIVCFTLFRGLRWETGTDWTPYLDIYNTSSFANVFSFDRGGPTGELMEPGYVFINAIFNILFPYTVFLLATNAFILWAYKYSISYFFNKRRVFIFCFMIISISFFPVRVDLANALLLLSLPFLKKNNFKWFIIIAIAAVSIHKSAIFLILLIFIINRIQFSIPVLIGIFLSSFVVGIAVIQRFGDVITPIIIMLDPSYENSLEFYFNRVDDESSRSLLTILNIVILIGTGLFALWRNNSLKKNVDYNMFLTLMTLYFSINLMLISAGLTWLSRETKYLFFTDAFVLAYVANSLSFSKEKHALAKVFLPLSFICAVIFALSINRYVKKCNFFPDLMFPYISVMDLQNHRPGGI